MHEIYIAQVKCCQMYAFTVILFSFPFSSVDKILFLEYFKIYYFRIILSMDGGTTSIAMIKVKHSNNSVGF